MSNKKMLVANKQLEMPLKGRTALVLLSGGQDSTTCLGVALKGFKKVYAIGFNYGQKHSRELVQAVRIADKHKVPLELFNLDIFTRLNDSALVHPEGDVNLKHKRLKHLPASFVPGRNALMLTIAHAYAQKIQADTIITGVCQTDFSGYPDCRQGFIKLFQEALNEGYETKINISTPLMFLTKAQTFALAEAVGILNTVLEDSHTCYKGDREHKHDWGYGCGECPACVLRAKGWDEYKNDRS